MRTTIDLPDELFRAAKAHAAMEGLSLRDIVTTGLKLVLSSTKEATSKVAETEPIPRRIVAPQPLRQRASAGAWARQFTGVAKPANGETIDDTRAAHFREKYGME